VSWLRLEVEKVACFSHRKLLLELRWEGEGWLSLGAEPIPMESAAVQALADRILEAAHRSEGAAPGRSTTRYLARLSTARGEEHFQADESYRWAGQHARAVALYELVEHAHSRDGV
jgi:hypothetical protein